MLFVIVYFHKNIPLFFLTSFLNLKFHIFVDLLISIGSFDFLKNFLSSFSLVPPRFVKYIERKSKSTLYQKIKLLNLVQEFSLIHRTRKL